MPRMPLGFPPRMNRREEGEEHFHPREAAEAALLQEGEEVRHLGVVEPVDIPASPRQINKLPKALNERCAPRRFRM